jgi:restriction endonuclease S subunit
MSVVAKLGHQQFPVGWVVKPIGDIFNVAERTVEMVNDQQYRRVTVKRRHGGIELRDIQLGIDIKVKKQYLIKTGDFLISERQIVHGACGIVPHCLEGAIVSNEYLVLESREGVDARYFNYLFQLLQYAKLFLLCSQGVDIEKFLFKPKDWLKKEIPVPPFPEQEKIATILTAVDDKLNVIARQIEATQTLKQGLMQALFSRGVGTQDVNDWPIVSLQEVAEVRTGVAKGKKGMKTPLELPYLRVANVQDGRIDLTEIKTIEVEAAQVQRYALQPGDVLMTEGGDFDKLGRGDVWEGQISPCLHQNHVFSVRPASDKLNSYYLAALAASDYGRRYFLSCAKRTTNLASINSSQLKAFPVVLPSLAVQEEIAKVVDAVNAKIAVLEEKRAAYQTLKRGLMQKLLTGEWRVSLGTHQASAIAA